MLSLPISTPLPNTPPRALTTNKPVRLILVGGFLGAGKTTALATLAQTLTERGLRVGIVTNDQAAHLVDTETTRQAGFTTSEVAGGCFCCRFTDFVDAAQEVLSNAQPDVLLCEPVGSCTDMAATVIAPLRHFYPDQLQIAPFAVLVDATRMSEHALGTPSTALAPEAAYIFAKQLEEADEIVLNKVDTLPESQAEELSEVLASRFGKPMRLVSATRGDGMADWADALLEFDTDKAGTHPLRDIDYDTYAIGEAVLGWLNLTATVTAASVPFPPHTFAERFLTRLQAACAAPDNDEPGAQIAHVKLSLTDAANHFLRANLTTSHGTPVLSTADAPSPTDRATLVLNARVQSSPERLERMVRLALDAAAAATNAAVTIDTLRCFSPSYPRPPYRVAASPGV